VLDIRPLTPGTWDTLAALFAQGGDPKWCWCAFWRKRGKAWGGATVANNRALLRRLAAREDLAPGLVAFQDDQAIGWVSLGPREDYERLEHSRVLARVDDKPVWSIVCFVVSRHERGQGVARKLLDAAVAYARDNGAARLEAYPIETDGGRVPSASAYTGTVGMYAQAGFRRIAARQATASSRPRPIYRLELGQRRRPRS
jgi:GNAT superfamily N-acetyltransferase